jgi:hypothetical protein
MPWPDDEDCRTIVELTIPIVGVVKESPYVDGAGTGTLRLSVTLDGYLDSSEQAVEEAVGKLEAALNEMIDATD